jgi:predicted Zn-dependent protease
MSGFSFGSIVSTAAGAQAGNPVDQENLAQLQRAGEAVSAATQEITPEQEYYIGRAVAATILQTYKPWDSPEANIYLTRLGRSLSLASVLPETFTGYHFLALDTDDINAFGAPSGFILVSRGLLRCATSEDEVAAILAHEIGHVSLKHGLSAISAGRWAEAAKQIALYAGQTSSSGLLRDLTSSFGGVVTDIAKTMIVSGYSRDLEKAADLEAVRILHDTGYDPNALVRVLKTMETHLKPGAPDFAKTHPDPKDRITYVTAAIGELSPVPQATAAQLQTRQARWKAALGRV